MSAEYLDVLVLCAEPVDLRPMLNLAQELVHFEQIIRRSELPIRMRRVCPPTLEQLRREFSLAEAFGRQPSVFHFLGHGDDDGLYFENELGQARLVKGRELKEVLSPSPVKLVLLNACWSATKRGVSLCDFLTREQVAGAAIGHERPVVDESAIEFAREFYTRAIEGRTIRESQQQAACSLAEQGKSGAWEVQLVGNGDLVLTAGLVTGGSRPPVIEDGQPRHGHLPDAGVFYGRGDELVAISQCLADQSRVGYGLWGIGGIGKTALARVAARRNAWRYQGAVWVDLRDLPQKTTNDLLGRALSRLHPGAPDSDPQFELARRLQQSPALIVLDNLEDLPLSEHESLKRFLEEMPRNGSHILLTARVPLPAIDAMPTVATRRLTEGLDPWNGAYYVRHIARQKNCLALCDELRERDDHQLEGMCALVTRRLHGHPKMLELAVGVALRGGNELKNALDILPDDLEEQLHSLLATSCKLLGQDGRRILPLLGFFPSGKLTPEAMEVVCRAVEWTARPVAEDDSDADEDDELNESDVAVTWFATGLRDLVAAGLLEYDQTRNIYTFHHAILDEVFHRRPSVEARSAAAIPLLLHYAKYLWSNQNDDGQLDRCAENALLLMESFWGQRMAVGPIDAVLTDMTDALGHYFPHCGRWRLGLTWHDRAIELRRSSSHAQNNTALAELLLQHGALLVLCGEANASSAALDEALKLFEQAGISEGIAATLHQLGIIERDQGKWREASQMFKRLLAIAESLDDKRGVGAALHELASIQSAQGNPSEARLLLLRSIAISERLGYQRDVSASLNQLAILEADQGNPSEARRLIQRSLAIDETSRDQHGLSATLQVLGSIEADQGNSSEARRLLQRSLVIGESLGAPRRVADALTELAVLEGATGNHSEARPLWERSLRIEESIGNPSDALILRDLLAAIDAPNGQFDRAMELACRLVRSRRQVGDTQAAPFHGIVRNIERFASQAPSFEPFEDRLKDCVSAWKLLSTDDQSARLTEGDRGNPKDAVLIWLAHGVVCQQRKDESGCDAALSQARTLARTIGDATMCAFVEAVSLQRAAVMSGETASPIPAPKSS